MGQLHLFGLILLVIVSCCANVVILEMQIGISKGAGNMVTVTQFLFLSLHGMIFVMKFGTVKPVVPLKEYAMLVVFFFASSAAGNAALGYNISMPLHMIFKSGSLLSTLLLGVVILKRSYPLSKYAAVVFITCGITICTLVSTDTKQQSTQQQSSVDSQSAYISYLQGIFLLSLSLIMATRTGIFQEQINTKYGKHPKEMLCYSHLFSLPGFVFMSGSIIEQFHAFNNSAPYEIPYVGVSVPILWWYMIWNIVTQFICINSVYSLISQLSALTVTLVLTLRKFISLVISIYVFKNPFTPYHWFGTALVFGGTLLFADIPTKLYNLMTSGSIEGGESKQEEPSATDPEIDSKEKKE